MAYKVNPEVRHTLRPIYDEWEWQQQGNCVGQDVEIFFLPTNSRVHDKAKREAIAKQICEGCPVVQECLDHALRVPENYGVWGGTTPEERAELLDRSLVIETDK